MKTRKHSLEFKEKVVKEYLAGKGYTVVCREYEIRNSQLSHWVKQWKQLGTFPDGRGKHNKGGRPKCLDPGEMTKDEYIKFLEMENDVLKQLRSLNSKKQS